MGEPVKLTCRNCGDSYFLHPASEKPVKDCDLCPTCETFQQGMRMWQEDEKPKNRTLGMLILGFVAICVLVLGGWAVWSSVR